MSTQIVGLKFNDGKYEKIFCAIPVLVIFAEEKF